METNATPTINVPLISDPYENFRYTKRFPSKSSAIVTQNLESNHAGCCDIFCYQPEGVAIRIVFAIITNALTISFLIPTIILYFAVNQIPVLWITFLSITMPFALLYLLTHIFLIPQRHYFDNNLSSEKAKAYFKQLLTSPPLIVMITKNYKNIEQKEKAVSHIQEEYFPYYSYRDVSGLFNFNLLPKSIRAEIVFEFNYADPITCMDYSQQKLPLYTRNLGKDQHTIYMKIQTIRNSNMKYLIINNDNEGKMFFSKITYYIFVFTGLAFIYHIVFYCCYKKHTFRIRKIVSTRYDITDNLNDDKYIIMKPKVLLRNEGEINFTKEETSGVFEKYKKPFPTEEELQKAMEFDKNVPRYQIGEIIGNSGVVKDSYDSDDYLHDVYPNDLIMKLQLQQPQMTGQNPFPILPTVNEFSNVNGDNDIGLTNMQNVDSAPTVFDKP